MKRSRNVSSSLMDLSMIYWTEMHPINQLRGIFSQTHSRSRFMEVHHVAQYQTKFSRTLRNFGRQRGILDPTLWFLYGATKIFSWFEYLWFVVSSSRATQDDEMCNFYIMYWTDIDQPISRDYCFSAGPPEWNWNDDPLLNAGNAPKDAR